MGTVGVRTAAGGVLSLEVTPADVIGRCDRCRTVFREGDWYCAHLAALHGHPLAWLSDQRPDVPAAVGAAPELGGRVAPLAFTVAFRSP